MPQHLLNRADVRAMEPYKGMQPKADAFEVTIEPNTFQSVSCFLRTPPKPKK